MHSNTVRMKIGSESFYLFYVFTVQVTKFGFNLFIRQPDATKI